MGLLGLSEGVFFSERKGFQPLIWIGGFWKGEQEIFRGVDRKTLFLIKENNSVITGLCLPIPSTKIPGLLSEAGTSGKVVKGKVPVKEE